MRQRLHVVRNFIHFLSQLLQASFELGRIALQLLKFNRQHCESLVDIVVKLSPNPSTLLLLGLDQLAGHLRKSLLRELAFSEIDVDADHSRRLTGFIHKSLPASHNPMNTFTRPDNSPLSSYWLSCLQRFFN